MASELEQVRARLAELESAKAAADRGDPALRAWTYVVCADCSCEHDHGGSSERPASVVCPEKGCGDKGSAHTETMMIPVGSQGPLLARGASIAPSVRDTRLVELEARVAELEVRRAGRGDER